jgi:hypothetical protein
MYDEMLHQNFPCLPQNPDLLRKKYAVRSLTILSKKP